MNRKFLLACVAVFVTWMAGSFVVHGMLLHGDYAQLPNIMRTEADSERYFPLMILAHVMLAVAFLTIVPTYLIYFVVQPMPGALVAKQIVFDGILILINGVVAAAIYRKP